MGKRYKIKAKKSVLTITRRMGSGKCMRATQFWGTFILASGIAMAIAGRGELTTERGARYFGIESETIRSPPGLWIGAGVVLLVLGV
jgi:hypothetical protein